MAAKKVTKRTPASASTARRAKGAKKGAAKGASKRPASSTSQKRSALPGENPVTLIDQRIAELGDWRGETLAHLRALIHAADPGVVEEWKWGVPVWSHDGIICTGETYKMAVKLTFARGASLKDPAKLFTSSLEGATRRAIDVRQGASIDEPAFKALVREAAHANGAAHATRGPTRAKVRGR